MALLGSTKVTDLTLLNGVIGNLNPVNTGVYDLGTSSLKWRYFYGDLKGNADTATKLATSRTISLTGSVTGSGSFDGSGNLSIATTTNHNHDSAYKKIQTAVTSPTASSTDIAFIDTISQNTQGVISATKKTVRDASASQSGVVSTGAQTFAGNKTFNNSIYFGANTSSGKAILGYNSSYPKYGIWYFDESVDVMTLSASGNGDSKTGADFSINAHGDGTLATRNNRIPHTGNTTGTVGGTVTPTYVNAGQITACERMFPVYYSNLDYTSTNPAIGAYEVNAQTHPVTGVAEYGSALTLPGIAESSKHYSAQLVISSASGQASPVHAYIRRLTSTPSWSNWSTLLDNNNYTTYTVKKDGTGATGTWGISITGNATTATTLETARTIQTNLASTSSASFNGSVNITPGITGTLGVGNGGTGKTSWTQWGILYASATTTLANTAAGADGNILIGKGSAAPIWYAGTVLTGTAAANYKTAFAGTTDSTSSTTGGVTVAGGIGIAKNATVNGGIGKDNVYIAYPGGGTYGASSASTVTGALCITLPQLNSSTMVQFKVHILNYNTSENITYNIQGYTNSSWSYTSAYSEGINGTHSDLKVTFMDDGSKKVILIGETTTTWSYPKVAITDVVFGHSSNNTFAKWGSGWSISFITTLPTASGTTVTKNAGTIYKMADIKVRMVSSTSKAYVLATTTAPTSSNQDVTAVANTAIYTQSGVLYGAAWNDYAEFRKDNEEEKDIQQPGRCVREVGDGTLALTTKRLERGCEIISDTFGFSIGQDEDNGYTTPIASSGRVLAYLYEDRDYASNYIGWPVCSGPDGTVSIMTEEEEEKYPSRIIGTISEIPDYEYWGAGNVKVNGRIWIRIR